MNNSDVNQQFLEFINSETAKMLAQFSGDEAQQAFNQFNQQWLALSQQDYSNPSTWLNTMFDVQKQQIELWGQLLAKTNPNVTDQADPTKVVELQIFDYIKKSYVVTSNMLAEMAKKSGLDAAEQEKLAFYTKQYSEAMSPDNFALTNPEVIQEAIDTNGQSLVNGLKNLMHDMDKGRISMTDESAFTLGQNIATTPGSIVYENELFQLIHYRPTTEKVHTKPTLIVPPCINKYYILDLQPHNSFVNYCVAQGQNTFLISWANPTKAQGHLSWDDYVRKGVINAIDIVKQITQTKSINAVSWCVGGTLLACTLAVLSERKNTSVSSATFLTTLVDFSDPGEISVFIDQQQIEQLLATAKKDGVLSGRQLATAFNMLRSRDLIWSYVVNNYLKGKQPTPFDILYWNGDSTNLPYEMYQFYITQMYLNNNLSKKNKLTICDSPIDLGSIDIPCYFLSTIGDHIAPWKSTFKGTELMSGKSEFVLGASGHVAGVINPVSKNKRHYWVNGTLGDGAQQWFESATKKEGSWWAHWNSWVKKRAGKKIAAVPPGNKQYPEIEPAPGRYVKVTLDDMS